MDGDRSVHARHIATVAPQAREGAKEAYRANVARARRSASR